MNPGDRLGPHEIARLPGRGAMGLLDRLGEVSYILQQEIAIAQFAAHRAGSIHTLGGGLNISWFSTLRTYTRAAVTRMSS
jgi:hypothetical protein